MGEIEKVNTSDDKYVNLKILLDIIDSNNEILRLENEFKNAEISLTKRESTQQSKYENLILLKDSPEIYEKVREYLKSITVQSLYCTVTQQILYWNDKKLVIRDFIDNTIYKKCYINDYRDILKFNFDDTEILYYLTNARELALKIKVLFENATKELGNKQELKIAHISKKYTKIEENIVKKYDNYIFKTKARTKAYENSLADLKREWNQEYNKVKEKYKNRVQNINNIPEIKSLYSAVYFYLEKLKDLIINEFVQCNSHLKTIGTNNLNNIETQLVMIDITKKNIKDLGYKTLELKKIKDSVLQEFKKNIPERYIDNLSALNCFVEYIYYGQANSIGECINIYEDRLVHEKIYEATISVNNSIKDLREDVNNHFRLLHMELFTINEGINEMIDSQRFTNEILEQNNNILNKISETQNRNSEELNKLIINGNKAIVGLAKFRQNCDTFFRAIKFDKEKHGQAFDYYS